MRLYIATITSNNEIRAGVHLIEMHVPALASAAQPGQYCMVRCCHPLANDPLLRRPFFVHSVQPALGLCTLMVHVQGRGTSWLTGQREGGTLDILGPLGHGWEVRPTVRNLLLVSESNMISSITLLAQSAIEQELAVTLVAHFASAAEVYPPALLPPEVEYHIITADGSLGEQGEVQGVLGDYLAWADAACCSVSRETAVVLYATFERMRGRNFAQALVLRPLVCASGVCLSCSFETLSGMKVICRDGPVFDLREIAHSANT